MTEAQTSVLKDINGRSMLVRFHSLTAGQFRIASEDMPIAQLQTYNTRSVDKRVVLRLISNGMIWASSVHLGFTFYHITPAGRKAIEKSGVSR